MSRKRSKPQTPFAASRFTKCAVVLGAVLALGAISAPPAGGQEPPDWLTTARPPGQPGGRLVIALRAEPRTFQPLLAVDGPSQTVLRRLHADLVHINRETQRTEPALARSWTTSADGRRFRLELRRGIAFSDGEPFDADDVVFSFQALLDPAVGSPNRDLLLVGGQPPVVRKLGSHTVEIELAAPYAVGDRLFDSLAILPEHLLGEAYREGRLAETWTTAARAAEIAGLGPFRLKRYLPGERLELERNPHYWKVDAKGQRLPYLEELVVLFTGSESAEVLRFEAGEIDLVDRLGAASFAALERGASQRAIELRDLGPGLVFHFVFFNLNELEGRDLPEIARKQAWFEKVEFRRAISAAIDREGIAKLVYQGRATPLAGPVPSGNKLWQNQALEPPKRSLDEARRLLSGAGFRWSDEGELIDPSGHEVGFTLITNASNEQRVQMATILQDDLRQLGIAVRVAPLEFRALLDRLLTSFDYEACLLGLGGGDVDPNPGMSVWPTTGPSHFWHLGQKRPATPWEAEIDRLMQRQLTEIDPAARKKLFDRVQEILAEQLPFLYLVSPNVLVGSRRDLGNFAPAVLDHSTLWNVEELYWRRSEPDDTHQR